jgi:hypothetical protein
MGPSGCQHILCDSLKHHDIHVLFSFPEEALRSSSRNVAGFHEPLTKPLPRPLRQRFAWATVPMAALLRRFQKDLLSLSAGGGSFLVQSHPSVGAHTERRVAHFDDGVVERVGV